MLFILIWDLFKCRQAESISLKHAKHILHFLETSVFSLVLGTCLWLHVYACLVCQIPRM